MSNVCCLASFHYLSSQYLIPQAAQAHYVWVRASEVIWSEYTRIISVLSDAKHKFKNLKVFNTRWRESRLNGV